MLSRITHFPCSFPSVLSYLFQQTLNLIIFLDCLLRPFVLLHLLLHLALLIPTLVRLLHNYIPLLFLLLCPLPLSFDISPPPPLPQTRCDSPLHLNWLIPCRTLRAVRAALYLATFLLRPEPVNSLEPTVTCRNSKRRRGG